MEPKQTALTVLLTTNEAAEFLRLKPNTLAKMRVAGNGPPFVKLGGRAVAYRKADLEAWISARVCSSTAEADRLRGGS